ncbi:MAG: hypothetical protein E5W40_17565 [Mesorhizobium sp.]|nr:MAG: hypothetical protein E5W40_17565 [Mesorhizobium sp.]
MYPSVRDLGKSTIKCERQNRKERQARQISQAPESPSLEAIDEPPALETLGRPEKKPNRAPSDQRSCQRNCYKTSVVIVYGGEQEVAGPNEVKPQSRSNASHYRLKVKQAGKETLVELAVTIGRKHVNAISPHPCAGLRGMSCRNHYSACSVPALLGSAGTLDAEELPNLPHRLRNKRVVDRA